MAAQLGSATNLNSITFRNYNSLDYLSTFLNDDTNTKSKYYNVIVCVSDKTDIKLRLCTFSGNVRHHLFIPPHVRHYFVPFLITKAVIVKSPYEVYPRAYGGFGVGAVTGGHGAGHGFHVVLHH